MSEPQQLTFWDHLDELRGSLIKMIAAVLVCTVVAFLFKQQLFDVVLAPQSNDFITYRLLEQVSDAVLAKATRNIDVIVGAHTHKVVTNRYVDNIDGNPVLLAQMGKSGARMGKILVEMAE